MAKRHITSVQIILEYAKNKSIDPSRLLAGSDIEAEALKSVESEIEDQQELIVLTHLLEIKGDPFLMGMELGSRYQLTSYGIFGYALLASATLRDALSFGQKYIELTFIFSDLNLQESDGSAAIEFTPHCDGELGHLVAIRDMWAVLVIMKELYPENPPSFTVELSIAKPSYLSDNALAGLEQQLGANIIFSSMRNAFSGLGRFLDLPLTKANALTAKMCEQQCHELLKQKHDAPAALKPSLSGQNRSTIQLVKDQLLSMGLETSMEEVASNLARTSRTLHRQLKDEGSSWRNVRDEVKLKLAQEYLKQAYPMDEIAERLGYSDAANFSHAFKRWKGITPSAYRKMQ